MTVRIPYLSGLAGRVPRTAVLRPPRPLFIGDSSTPTGARVGPIEAPFDPPAGASPMADPNAAQTTPTAGSRTWVTADGASAGSRTAADDGTTGGGTTGGAPGEAAVPGGPVPAAVVAPALGAASLRPRADRTPNRTPNRTPATTVTSDAPLAPLLGGGRGAGSHRGAEPPARAALEPLAAAPTTWTDPRWGLPAPLPPGAAPPQDYLDTVEDRARHASSAPAAGAKLLPVGGAIARDMPPGSAATTTAATDQTTAATDQTMPTLRPAADPAFDPRRLADRPAAGRAGPGPHQRRSAGGRLSIGTIEVTVTAPPTPATPPGPKRPLAARRPRPAVAAAPASRPADPLRDGRRRWYGTAQG